MFRCSASLRCSPFELGRIYLSSLTSSLTHTYKNTLTSVRFTPSYRLIVLASRECTFTTAVSHYFNGKVITVKEKTLCNISVSHILLLNVKPFTQRRSHLEQIKLNMQVFKVKNRKEKKTININI